MPEKSDEQFDVLSNTLRMLPEEILRLNYFIKEIDEPEEGISNVEIACLNVLNNIYGLMCSLKEEGATNSIYEHPSIATVLCIRHILQHQSGRIRNNLRDAYSGNHGKRPALIKFNVSDQKKFDSPFYISVQWFQEGIANSNNAKRLTGINEYLNLHRIQQQVEASPSCSWKNTYICAMALITEAVREIVFHYRNHFDPIGYDSTVYYEHFSDLVPLNTSDYAVIT